MHPAIRQLRKAMKQLVEAELNDGWAGANDLANYEAYAEKLKAAKKFMKHTLNYINERLPR